MMAAATPAGYPRSWSPPASHLPPPFVRPPVTPLLGRRLRAPLRTKAGRRRRGDGTGGEETEKTRPGRAPCHACRAAATWVPAPGPPAGAPFRPLSGPPLAARNGGGGTEWKRTHAPTPRGACHHCQGSPRGRRPPPPRNSTPPPPPPHARGCQAARGPPPRASRASRRGARGALREERVTGAVAPNCFRAGQRHLLPTIGV